MGVGSAFVFLANRRAILAVAAIAVSVSYALVAGAASYGLGEAQDVLADASGESYWVATRADGAPFDPAAVPDGVHVLVTFAPNETFFHASGSVPDGPTAGGVFAGPATGLRPGQQVDVGGEDRRVNGTTLPDGAPADGVWVTQADFARLGGDPAVAHVAVYDELSDGQRQQIEVAGLSVVRTPGVVGFYEGGADQLVGSVRFTVLASSLVVALVVAAFLGMELRARRRSYATLRLFATRRSVARLVFLRGLVVVAAGHAAGAAFSYGVVGLARLADAAPLRLPLGYAAAALLVTGSVGVVLGVAPGAVGASRRLMARDLGQRSGMRTPRWLRLTVSSWRLVVPVAAAALVLATSVTVALGTVALPDEVFGSPGGDERVLADAANNPLRGTVDAFVGLHMARAPEVEAASPEIFAPTVVADRPTMVRGVSWDHLVGLDGVGVSDGRALEGPGEAVAGSRVADRLGLAIGDSFLVASSYRASALPLTLVGVATGPGILEDEVLVTLEDARALTDLGPEDVNLVRYRLAAPFAGLDDAVGFPDGLVVTDLRVEPEDPVPFEPAEARVDLVNFAAGTESRRLTLTVAGEDVADRWVQVPGRSEATVSLAFTVPAAGLGAVEVNPTIFPPTGDAAYRIEAPERVVSNATLAVRVVTPAGDPAADVAVSLDGSSATTDAEGRAALAPSAVGNRTIVAEGPEGRGAARILVTAPEDANRAHLELRRVEGPASARPGTWTGVSYFENVGGVAFRGDVAVPVEGVHVTVAEDVTVFAGQTLRAEFSVGLQEGTVLVGTSEAGLRVDVRTAPPPGSDEDPVEGPATLEELLERRWEQARQRTAADADPGQAFLEDTFANIEGALTVVLLVSGLHAGLIVWAAVLRGVEDRAPNVAAYRAVGAGRSSLRKIAVQEHLLVSAPAAVVGTGLGLFLAWLGADLGILAGFGHALSPMVSWGVAFRLAIVVVAMTLVAAVYAAARVRQGVGSGASFESGPTRGRRVPLEALVGGPR